MLKDEVAAGFVKEIAEKIRSTSTNRMEEKKGVERVEKEESKPETPTMKQ